MNNEAISQLNSSISEIDALGNDQNNTYEFVKVSGDEGHHITKLANGNIGIQYSSTAIKLHETRHAFQYMTDKGNNWTWNSNNQLAPNGSYKSMVNWGISEKSAYRLQYTYNSSSMPTSTNGSLNSIYDVTYNWVGGISSTYQKFMPYMKQYEKVKLQQHKAFRLRFFNSL